ncbi:hypothetical protein L3Q82_020868 [Scortum barcoo]|uniref:Uncharacterized protein n=1 Tax=Scortum barcoo TaxID=214431 RepID=A0ACB8V958_9TELE|nr:hypothetical protein L3Q82_020868 [Scortum barcoo]
MDTLMLEHGVRYGQTVTSYRSPITEHRWFRSGGRSSRSRPSRDSKKARVLCTAVRPVGTNNSKRPIPNPKAQGSDPLVHRGELQHVAWLSWGAISKPTPARRRSPWATPE